MIFWSIVHQLTVAAWVARAPGGKHRDAAPLPDWIAYLNKLERGDSAR